MAKTKNDARVAWAEAEDEYQQVISAYTAAMGAEPLDRAALAIIAKARSKAERCLDAYARRCLGT
jgi:hypothetical protein